MTPPSSKRRLSEEEYLAIERFAEFRSEFIDREMRPIGPAGPRHTRIVGNLFAGLHHQFRGRRSEAHMNDVRVRVGSSGLYTYPDIVAVSGDPSFLEHDGDTLLNAQLIMEVLSPITESYDRGEKFRRYRLMETLTDYVLVSQERMLVEQWRRQTRDLWTVQFFRDPDDMIHFEAPAADLLVAGVYQGVDLAAETPPHLR